MLSTTQIILRLVLSLIFGLVIFWFRKEKEKIFALKIYLLSSLAGSFLSILSLKFFFTFYSKLDFTIILAALTLGIFILGGALVGKEETKEAINSLFFLWLISLVGLTIGFGFYNLAIFATLLILIVIFLTGLSNLVNLIKKRLKKK